MESKFNNVNTTLDIGETWTGEAEVVNGFIIILIDIKSSEPCSIIVRQSDNESNYNFEKTIEYLPLTGGARYQVYRNSFYCYVQVVNTSGNVIPDLIIRTHFLNIGRDPTIFDPLIVAGAVEVLNPMKAFDYVNEVSREVACDSNGNLIMSSGGGGGNAVTVTSGNISVDNFPGYQPSIEVSNFPAVQTVDGTVEVSNYSPFSGTNTDFAFYPDATNSTSAIYADGQQPTATNQAGWVYTNNGTAPNKINWYIFQDVSLPQYLVSDMESIYFVITQLPTATTLPFVGFYTMPNGIDDVVPNFAKSRLVFAPSGAVPTTQGEYLFYVGDDPTDSRGVPIRPEITNRYQLTFVAAQSSKTLLQAAGERLSLATLSTNSTDPTGSNYFLFQQYGIQWAKTIVRLPVDNDRLLTTETNSGTISSTLTTLNGKVTVCDTENVTITSIPEGAVVLSRASSSITTYRNNHNVKSFNVLTLIAKQSIADSPTRLVSIRYYNDNTTASPNFLLIYDSLFANVIIGTTTPKTVVALNRDDGGQIEFYDVFLAQGLVIVPSGTYDGSGGVVRGSGIYLTVFYY